MAGFPVKLPLRRLYLARIFFHTEVNYNTIYADFKPITNPDKVQYVNEDNSNPLSGDKIKYIQKVIGKFLLLARAIDNTQLHALNELASKVAKGTQNTLDAATYLLNYITSNPRPRTQYQASDMILQIDSNPSFQVCD